MARLHNMVSLCDLHASAGVAGAWPIPVSPAARPKRSEKICHVKCFPSVADG